MEEKLSKKCVNLISGNSKLKSSCFRFGKLIIKPHIKGHYYKNVLKKGNNVKTYLIVNNDKKKNVKPTIKVSKTMLNQVNVMYHYKQKQLYGSDLLTKNVFYLNKKQNKFLNFCLLILIGLMIGFVNGFWGGGGGMICVPTLTLILGLPDKKAHATAILIMLPLSISSFIVYMLKGTIDFAIAGIVSGGFVVGGILGAMLLKKANNIVIQIIFALVIIAGAIKILI